MGAVEVAMRTTGQRQTTEVFEPTLGMVFDSYEEGYEFYNLYSWEAGFGIIYNRNATRKNDKNYRTMQEFCCQKGVISVFVNLVYGFHFYIIPNMCAN
jgi:hypothetical protein